MAFTDANATEALSERQVTGHDPDLAEQQRHAQLQQLTLDKAQDVGVCPLFRLSSRMLD